jgi:hypothetical protein
MTTISTNDSSIPNDNNEEKLNIISKKASKKRERSPSMFIIINDINRTLFIFKYLF